MSSWLSRTSWLALCYALLGQLYRMLDAWSNTEFLLERDIPPKIAMFLNTAFQETAVFIVFAVGFLWLVFQTNWLQNLIRRTSLRAAPQSFPLGGWSVTVSDMFPPHKGHATIAVKNVGQFLENCTGTVVYMAVVNPLTLDERSLSITSGQLCWASGHNGECRATTVNLPNDDVPRHLNHAYLDQARRGVWQLALADRSQRQNFGPGWYRIKMVISSESKHANALRVDIALGFANRPPPAIPAGLNIWPWAKWEKGIKKQRKQEHRKEENGSRT